MALALSKSVFVLKEIFFKRSAVWRLVKYIYIYMKADGSFIFSFLVLYRLIFILIWAPVIGFVNISGNLSSSFINSFIPSTVIFRWDKNTKMDFDKSVLFRGQ